ncbi:hypothetical protein [Nocardioides sp. T2.26MG-1]|uniref:hypothetical protein n=1 Tax=Nocardioides sp. T2.26MG-1 TaxID=3041166 RepID=UPI0024773C5A|nr:hypothetical protein [Nocardioides sp. T2.26MG-1]CAI9403008.1 hypothetical protein HIDPHFAB_00932 [Nocardioides sp. T2.26MG-1]
MSDHSRVLAGVLLLSLVTVELGGLYVFSILSRRVPATPFQERFARAGHAHAGVLLILSLVNLLYVELIDLGGPWVWLARAGIPSAALLMPAGFFLAAAGAGRTRPNGFVVLLPVGGVVLAVGLLTTGVGLLTA